MFFDNFIYYVVFFGMWQCLFFLSSITSINMEVYLRAFLILILLLGVLLTLQGLFLFTLFIYIVYIGTIVIFFVFIAMICTIKVIKMVGPTPFLSSFGVRFDLSVLLFCLALYWGHFVGLCWLLPYTVDLGWVLYGVFTSGLPFGDVHIGYCLVAVEELQLLGKEDTEVFPLLESLSVSLFVTYRVLNLLIALLLLVGLVGAIHVTLDFYEVQSIKRQKIEEQQSTSVSPVFYL